MFSEIFCTISGRVQGVGYRDFVTHAASECTLVGYVKNHEDGTVEVLAQGLPDDLKTFLEALHEGSVLAEVESIGVDWRTPKEQFDDFKMLFK